MKITIELNDFTLSEQEKNVLLALAGSPVVTTLAQEPEAKPAPAPEKPATTRRAPAAKAKAPEPDPEPEEEPAAEEQEEDLLGAEPTMADATRESMALLADGKQAVVKAALSKFGAARVSELKSKDIAAYLKALADA